MFEIEINQHTRKLFDKRNIFFWHSPGFARLQDGEKIFFDDSLKIEPFTAFLAANTLCTMGSFSYSWSCLPSSLSIGRYCSIASGLSFLGMRHPLERFTTSSITYDSCFNICTKAISDNNSKFMQKPVKPWTFSPTVIENDVWIGDRVTLKPGVRIGNGAVVGALSLVTKDVPPYAVVGGVPSKIIKFRFKDSIIADLLDLAWWKYSFVDFKDYNIDSDIDVFVNYIKQLIDKNRLSEYLPTPLTAPEILDFAATVGGVSENGK